MLTTRALLSVIALVFFTGASASQTAEPLFIVGNGASSAREHETVGMRLDHLFAATTDRVLLNIADHSWVATLERIDSDLFGHRVWVGRIDDVQYSHVSFAERDGVVSGLINGLSAVYQVRTLSPGRYEVERAAADEQNGELNPLTTVSNGVARVTASPLRELASDEGDTIDVLLLYTPGATARIGGPAQMQALVAQIISDSNTIFARSGIATRLRLTASQPFALTESASMAEDLHALTGSPTARALRDQFKADLVQLLEETAQPSACGVAWQLTSLDEPNFDAYSVTDVDCVAQYTPTHEMGHNMGSHHAPEDDVSFPLFSYSYGYKDPAHRFRTVMAYPCTNANCPRIPAMSNPLLSYEGAPAGTATQNNALSINKASAAVANFRQHVLTTNVPAAPTGLASSVVRDTAAVSWNIVTTDVNGAPTTVDGYGISVRSTAHPTEFVANVGPTLSVAGALPSGTYVWRVFAYNSAGLGPPSLEQTITIASPCTTPGMPRDVRFTVRERVLGLLWQPPAEGGSVATYVVEAGTASGMTSAHAITSALGIEAVAPPGTYFVRVRAQNACGPGPASVERVVVVP